MSPQSDALRVYRKDIDGLRAVAVLLVLGAHLRSRLTGGYIGVDVFFVISGYLIGAAILRELADGSFSIAAFYERRIRRIVPALLGMLIGASALAYHFLFPSEIIDFAKSLLAAIGSVSNLWFWHQSGYFDAPSAFKPLLHTWSLAVEEQFYIVFPIFLVLIRRFFPKHLKLAICTVAAISFALAVFYVRRDPGAAFYFAPLRAWELLLGTIVSQRYLPPFRTALTRNLASAAGLVMIFIPALRYTSETPFPGIAALPPCLGAALIIAAGDTGSSLGGRLLSLRPVTFIGLISYSVYLWHWPVLVFQDIGQLVTPRAWGFRLKLELLAISLLLGYLSWRFVETPFRKGRMRPRRRPLFLINGVAAAIVASVGIAILLSHGLPSRFPPDAIQAVRYLDYDRKLPYREGTCFLTDGAAFSTFDRAKCLSTVPGEENVLLYGDSQAAQLWPGLSTVFPNVHFLQATAVACVLPVHPPPGTLPGCRDLADFMHNDFLPHAHITAVLLGGRWDEGTLPILTEQVAWFQQRGIAVYVAGPVPDYSQPLPRLLAVSLRDHNPAFIASHLNPEPRALDLKIAALARDRWHVPYISYFDNLCTPACPNYAAPGVPLYFDGHHLTAEGSILFAQTIRDRKQLALPSDPPPHPTP